MRNRLSTDKQRQVVSPVPNWFSDQKTIFPSGKRMVRQYLLNPNGCLSVEVESSYSTPLHALVSLGEKQCEVVLADIVQLVEHQFSKLVAEVRNLLFAQTTELQVSRDMAESLCQQGEGTVGSNQPSGKLNGRYADNR